MFTHSEALSVGSRLPRTAFCLAREGSPGEAALWNMVELDNAWLSLCTDTLFASVQVNVRDSL